MGNNSSNVLKADADVAGKKKSSSKLLSVLGIIACIILTPILALNIFLLVQGFTASSETLPNVGGYFPLMVQSGSMSGTIEVGDLIICLTPEDAQKLQVGDIITYWDGAPGGTLVTHRIVDVTKDDKGALVYQTKGDANNTVDSAVLYPEKIVGIYSLRIPYLGDVALFMQTIPGLIVCVVLPLALFIIYDMVRRRRIGKKAKAETDELLAELERLKKENASASNAKDERE